ncbi:MAG: phytanoyl-CoA dioxygenase family protein [Myxococcota bacterium]
MPTPAAPDRMDTLPPSVSRELELAFPVSDEEVAAFREQGFVHLRQVFSRELIEFFRPKITQAVEKDLPNPAPLEERDSYGKSFLQVPNLWTRHSEVRPLSLSRRCAGIASALLETRGVRMWHDQALFKEAGGGRTAWHCDQFFWPLSSDRSISAWIPLQDTPVEFGAVQFAGGSHRHDHGRHLGITDEGEEQVATSIREHGLAVHREDFALGDVSFHSGWTFHRAEPNASGQMRGVMTVIYIDQAMRVAEPANPFQKYDQDTWAPGCQVGDPIASEINPILYSVDDSSV